MRKGIAATAAALAALGAAVAPADASVASNSGCTGDVQWRVPPRAPAGTASVTFSNVTCATVFAHGGGADPPDAGANANASAWSPEQFAFTAVPGTSSGTLAGGSGTWTARGAIALPGAAAGAGPGHATVVWQGSPYSTWPYGDVVEEHVITGYAPGCGCWTGHAAWHWGRARP